MSSPSRWTIPVLALAGLLCGAGLAHAQDDPDAIGPRGWAPRPMGQPRSVKRAEPRTAPIVPVRDYSSISIALFGSVVSGDVFEPGSAGTLTRAWEDLFEVGGGVDLSWRLSLPLGVRGRTQFFAGPALVFTRAAYDGARDTDPNGNVLEPDELRLTQAFIGGHMALRVEHWFCDAQAGIGSTWMNRVHATYDPAGSAVGPSRFTLFDRERMTSLMFGLRVGRSWEFETGTALAIWASLGSTVVAEPENPGDPASPYTWGSAEPFITTSIGFGVTLRFGSRAQVIVRAVP